jgi:hypothetical protein
MGSTSDDAAAAAGQNSYKSLGLNISLNGANATFFLDATITDTSAATGIVITYNGTNFYNGIKRSGTITITSNGTPWHEQGAVLTVQYTNLTVTDEISGNTYVLNGTHTITNETGGLAYQVVLGTGTATSVTHLIQSSNMKVTLPGGSQRTWTVDRSRTWTRTGNVVTVSLAAGSGAAGSSVTESGTNRFGEAFTNSITQTISADNNDGYRPYTGTFIHQIGTATGTVTFGTSSSGTQEGTAATTALSFPFGSYGYYITYVNGSATRSRFVSYWN